MRIESRFKDYYDHVAANYGSGDSKLVYVRNQVEPSHTSRSLYFDGRTVVPETLSLWLPNSVRVSGLEMRDFKALVVAGRFYIIERLTRSSIYIPPQEWRVYRKVAQKYKIGAVSSRAVSLARLVNAPVFTVSHEGDRQVVDIQVPNLGELGFAAIMRAEVCYQEISLFVGQDLLLTETPEISNRRKLEARGYANQSSVRHIRK